jgi:hypothetical protein
MKSLKTFGLVLLVAAAVAGAGYSLYRNFIYKPESNLTEEQRAKAQQMLDNMGKMRGKSLPAPAAGKK